MALRRFVTPFANFAYYSYYAPFSALGVFFVSIRACPWSCMVAHVAPRAGLVNCHESS